MNWVAIGQIATVIATVIAALAGFVQAYVAIHQLKNTGKGKEFTGPSEETPTIDIDHSDVRKLHQTFIEDLGNSVGLDMVAIPGGKFMMGSPKDKTRHEVMIKPFFMGKYPVTQAQWRVVASLPRAERVLKLKPSRYKGNQRPVERVSWLDAIEFCKRLSRWTGRVYRLPSEAEWEYACRAGTTTAYYFGDRITKQQANYGQHIIFSSTKTTPVGKYQPNAFGLYDMHGNVREWCQDKWHEDYQGAPTDGTSWSTGHHFRNVLRGGTWWTDGSQCRSFSRFWATSNFINDGFGFRVVCDFART